MFKNARPVFFLCRFLNCTGGLENGGFQTKAAPDTCIYILNKVRALHTKDVADLGYYVRACRRMCICTTLFFAHVLIVFRILCS